VDEGKKKDRHLDVKALGGNHLTGFQLSVLQEMHAHTFQDLHVPGRKSDLRHLRDLVRGLQSYVKISRKRRTMNIVGTVWQGNEGKKFRVIKIAEEQDNAWVHYKNIKTEQTYNCYLEAFLSRFTKVPE